MKPADHADFFRCPAPPGRSRESTIVLDAEGRFFHDGAIVEHPGLRQALPTWIARHPDDGRFVLSNGYDWSYFTVQDSPFFVLHVEVEGDDAVLLLSDGSRESLRPNTLRFGGQGALYATVKSGEIKKGGPFEAKFSRLARLELAPFLREPPQDESTERNTAAVSVTTRLGTITLHEPQAPESQDRD